MKHLYRIRIQGHLGDDWSDWFAGLQMTRLANGETQLTGELDQTALHGVLARIRDLNMTLIAANQFNEASTNNEGTQANRCDLPACGKSIGG